jgi:hypothetical protein
MLDDKRQRDGTRGNPACTVVCVGPPAGRRPFAYVNRRSPVDFGHAKAEASVIGVWTVRTFERRTDVSVTGIPCDRQTRPKRALYVGSTYT